MEVWKIIFPSKWMQPFKHFPLKMSTFQKRLFFDPLFSSHLEVEKGGKKTSCKKSSRKDLRKFFLRMMFGIWYLHLHLFCGNFLSIPKLLKVAVATLRSLEKKHQNPHKENCHKRWRYHTKWWYFEACGWKKWMFTKLIPKFQTKEAFVWSCLSSSRLKSEPRKNPGLTFHYTGCLMGILIMVYYNLHLTV